MTIILSNGNNSKLILLNHGIHTIVTFRMVVTSVTKTSKKTLTKHIVIIRISGRNTLSPQLIHVPLHVAHIPTIMTT